MKKIFLIIICALFCLIEVSAQDTIVTIPQLSQQFPKRINACVNKYDRVLLYAPDNCSTFKFEINGEWIYNVSPIIFETTTTDCWFNGCGYDLGFGVYFIEPNVPDETTTSYWKRQYEPITLEAPSGYSYLWNTGATTPSIEVTEPGTYTCAVSDMCATSVLTFIVQDNVEIDLATCDLESNLNMVTWRVTEEQAEYIDYVILKRDGLQVGSADYTDGYFLDNIGSGSASRTYTVTAVASDGTDCPIVSYPKETIHMAYLIGLNATIEVNWNIPTGYDLLGYNICEWTPDEKEGELTIIDFVGANVTSYTCSGNMFHNGYVVVQGVEDTKNDESRLLSNRSDKKIDGLVNTGNISHFNVYPNPTDGEFTVVGTTDLTIYNILGQVVTTSHTSENVHKFSLGSGIYFIKSAEGLVKKLIVK
ncbi:MAG: T9SS type A sorting domain-containing protein [Bacteroidales bacterium]|nr:T9SS type A sorting domain-containing protein [Bacteroidales bacterium]